EIHQFGNLAACIEYSPESGNASFDEGPCAIGVEKGALNLVAARIKCGSLFRKSVLQRRLAIGIEIGDLDAVAAGVEQLPLERVAPLGQGRMAVNAYIGKFKNVASPIECLAVAGIAVFVQRRLAIGRKIARFGVLAPTVEFASEIGKPARAGDRALV